jgi:hypothetical protein
MSTSWISRLRKVCAIFCLVPVAASSAALADVRAFFVGTSEAQVDQVSDLVEAVGGQILFRGASRPEILFLVDEEAFGLARFFTLHGNYLRSDLDNCDTGLNCAGSPVLVEAVVSVDRVPDVDLFVELSGGTVLGPGSAYLMPEGRLTELQALEGVLSVSLFVPRTPEGAFLGSMHLGRRHRFEVLVEWAEGQPVTGRLRPREVGRDSGLFWFFDPGNAELLIKILDGCALNGHFWVFLGGLTDLAVVVRVDDRLVGANAFYTNAGGSALEPQFDVRAFPCEPD